MGYLCAGTVASLKGGEVPALLGRGLFALQFFFNQGDELLHAPDDDFYERFYGH
jgi:hypothetical protein